MSLRGLFVALLAVTGLTTQVWAKDLDPENTLYLELKDGRVVIEMYPAFAPETVTRIKTLAREKFYDGLKFHRVIEGFMAQTGDPRGDGTGGSSYPDLPDEFNIKRHWRGVVSMANAGVANSANSQFFIMFADNRALDGKYTVWGRVREGMQFVDNIKKGDPYQNGAIQGAPDRIVSMRVMADVEPNLPPPAESTVSSEDSSEDLTAESSAVDEELGAPVEAAAVEEGVEEGEDLVEEVEEAVEQVEDTVDQATDAVELEEEEASQVENSTEATGSIEGEVDIDAETAMSTDTDQDVQEESAKKPGFFARIRNRIFRRSEEN